MLLHGGQRGLSDGNEESGHARLTVEDGACHFPNFDVERIAVEHMQSAAHHRDTESAEDAQRKEFKTLCVLCVLCVSVVNATFTLAQLALTRH